MWIQTTDDAVRLLWVHRPCLSIAVFTRGSGRAGLRRAGEMQDAEHDRAGCDAWRAVWSESVERGARSYIGCRVQREGVARNTGRGMSSCCLGLAPELSIRIKDDDHGVNCGDLALCVVIYKRS